MAAMILAEIGDVSRFDSLDKLLAFSGFSPSTYQSGKMDNAYAHMENEVPNIFVSLFTKLQSMFLIGIRTSPLTLKRNALN